MTKPEFIEYAEPYDAMVERVLREAECADEEQARVEQEREDRIREWSE